MIQLIIAILLSAACAFADDSITIINAQTVYTATQPDSTPKAFSAAVLATDSSFDVDPYVTCDYLASYQSNLSASAPLNLLVGANWRQLIQPTKNGVPQDYTGKRFTVDFVPAKPMNVFIDITTTMTETYTAGVTTYSWWNGPTMHNGRTYAYLRDGVDPAWLSLVYPYWHTTPSNSSTGDTTNGTATWVITGHYNVSSADFYGAVPLSAQVVASAGQLDINLDKGQTAQLDGATGGIVVNIMEQNGDSIAAFGIPVEIYPTVSRNPPFTPDFTVWIAGVNCSCTMGAFDACPSGTGCGW